MAKNRDDRYSDLAALVHILSAKIFAGVNTSEKVGRWAV
jgi:hypothetical protein